MRGCPEWLTLCGLPQNCKPSLDDQNEYMLMFLPQGLSCGGINPETILTTRSEKISVQRRFARCYCSFRRRWAWMWCSSISHWVQKWRSPPWMWWLGTSNKSAHTGSRDILGWGAVNCIRSPISKSVRILTFLGSSIFFREAVSVWPSNRNSYCHNSFSNKENQSNSMELLWHCTRSLSLWQFGLSSRNDRDEPQAEGTSSTLNSFQP